MHTVERLHRAPEQRSFPVADVLGAGSKWSYWSEAPGAREHLSRAQSMADLDAAALWVSSTDTGRTSSSSPVIFTRHGLVALLPGFIPGHVDVEPLSAFLAGTGDRAALAQDERLSALPLPLILLGIGAFLILLRGPAPRPDRGSRGTARG